MVMQEFNEQDYGTDPLENIATLSNLFAQPSVLEGDHYQNIFLGGGNTSVGLGKVVYIKPSGVGLKGIRAGQFCRIDADKMIKGREGMETLCDKVLREDYTKDFSNVKELDDMFKELSIDANLDGIEEPSCETRLHILRNGTETKPRYNVHEHNSLVNGWLCSNEVREHYRPLFGGNDDDILFLPDFVETGAPLSIVFGRKVQGWDGSRVFLGQHGEIQSGYSPKEVWDVHMKTVNTVFEYAKKRLPEHTFGVEHVPSNTDSLFYAQPAIEYLEGIFEGKLAYSFAQDPLLLKMLHSGSALKTIEQGAPNPDAQVYGGAAPMVVDFDPATGKEGLKKAIDKAKVAYLKRFSSDDFKLNLDRSDYLPKIVLIKGVCAITLGDYIDEEDEAEKKAKKRADNAYAALLDTVNIMKWAEAFGGMKPLSYKHMYYINNWDLEKRRAKMAAGGK